VGAAWGAVDPLSSSNLAYRVAYGGGVGASILQWNPLLPAARDFVNAASACSFGGSLGDVIGGLGWTALGAIAPEEDEAVVAAEEDADLAGIVYRRTDLNGSKPYVGQSKSLDRFIARQAEHARANPDADFEYEVLGRAEPGSELDRLEEYWIRELGGPTSRGNPGGILANMRHQMSELRYQSAGGNPFP
jgi:hypothetical protein